MKAYSNKNDILKAVRKRINDISRDVVKNEVSEEIKETIVEHAFNDVYSAGSPMQYKRRQFEGGIVDAENLNLEVIDTSESSVILRFTDTAKFTGPRKWNGSSFPSDYMLSDLIEDGYGTMPEWYNQPRQFIENAKKELEESDRLEKVFKKAIEKRL